MALSLLSLLSLELSQETQVVAGEEANLPDGILQHGDTLNAHTEGETAIFRWVIANFPQHAWMHHARAEHLDPATILAGATALPVTDGAIDVHLSTWLGEREVAPTEAHLPPFAEQFASNPFQASLEISHGTILVDQEALDLVEHGLV